MRTVKFGIIGCGLMGREFVSAAARWCHLPEMDVKPEIVAVCNRTASKMDWFKENIPTVKQTTTDYKELLANEDIEAVYIAVPHNLHVEFYCAAIEAGKHLLGEKPFGIDQKGNYLISECVKKHPNIFVRCASEFPFFPGAQKVGKLIEANTFGQILEINCGFLHSSDLDFNKPINWKRMLKFNGEYGCMGDLGMHVCHIPFRAGWIPKNVRAILSNVVAERPDGKGGRVPCETWDNATLFCETAESDTRKEFPMTIKTQRIAPGQKNTWYLEIMGTKTSCKWSTKQINTLEILEYKDGQQAWQVIDMGHEMAYKSITGGIFEAGFSDCILQMWAAFLYELAHGKLISKFAGCVTPEEVALSHSLFTAALESQRTKSVIEIKSPIL